SGTVGGRDFAKLRRGHPAKQCRAGKNEARREAGLRVLPSNRGSVLHVQLGAAVARTAFAGVVGVDRAALAEAVRTHQTAGVDALAGQVVVHGGGATLRQALVVLLGADRVGVASDFDAQLRVLLQDRHGLVEDR